MHTLELTVRTSNVVFLVETTVASSSVGLAFAIVSAITGVASIAQMLYPTFTQLLQRLLCRPDDAFVPPPVLMPTSRRPAHERRMHALSKPDPATATSVLWQGSSTSVSNPLQPRRRRGTATRAALATVDTAAVRAEFEAQLAQLRREFEAKLAGGQ